MTNSMILNYKIKQSGLRLDFISKKLNLSRAGLYNKINGITEFYASEIQELSNILNLSKEEKEKIFFDKEVD